nr:hypothetical protein [Tanacetum cinerariifolium]
MREKMYLHRSLPTTRNPSGEPWNSDSEEAHPSKALGKTFVEHDEMEPIRATPLDANNTKGKGTQNVEFYHQPFVFKETNRDTKDLVSSPFTNRIREYDMPDGLKVPANLKTYDGMSDPDDHLTVFMETMDVHKLPDLVWCRLFPITLCGATRFWYENLAPGSIDGFHQLRDKFRANFLQQCRFQKTQAEILGIQKCPDDSLKDYVTRATIPLTSLEGLFTQTHNFIRAEETNNENRLREPRQGNRKTKQHATYKDLPRRPKEKYVSRAATRYNEHHKAPHNPFTTLIKSPAESFATVECKSILRPLLRCSLQRTKVT